MTVKTGSDRVVRLTNQTALETEACTKGGRRMSDKCPYF